MPRLYSVRAGPDVLLAIVAIACGVEVDGSSLSADAGGETDSEGRGAASRSSEPDDADDGGASSGGAVDSGDDDSVKLDVSADSSGDPGGDGIAGAGERVGARLTGGGSRGVTNSDVGCTDRCMMIARSCDREHAVDAFSRIRVLLA